MNNKFYRPLILAGLCLLLAVLLPGSALAQNAGPPLPPTPEPDGAIPEAPVPEIEEDVIQELSVDGLTDEISFMAGGIAQRVADINPGSESSYPEYLQVFNSQLYFQAYGGDGAGYELWVYDGSSPPYRAVDIVSGPNSSYPEHLQMFNNQLYFQADDGGGTGRELWTYDGISAYCAVDINSGSESSSPAYLQVFNNLLYFAADGGDGAGFELWAYNGSSASLVADIRSGSSNSSPQYLQVFNNQLYFQANGGDGAGYELWTYDGSNPPYRVADINSTGSSFPAYLQVFNNQLYFKADGGDSAGFELWAYDGSNLPTRVADINSGSSDSYPQYLQVLNNLLYFYANGGDDAGYELWAYDGSSAFRVADIYPGSDSSSPEYLQVFNNQLYFRANGGDGAGTELWVYIPTLTKTFKSSGAYDGWVLESARTSNKGGSLNKGAATLSVGDDAQNRQYRGILHFNTASLPDNAVITSVKLQVRRAGIKGTNPFTTHGALYVDLRKGAFSNNAALQAADWQAPASKLAAGKIPKTCTNNWHTLNLAAANLKFINKLGITQLRLRFAKQDNGDNGADYVNFYSGNAAAANRPKLIITYYVP